MSNKVNANTKELEFKRKHNNLVDSVLDLAEDIEEIPNVETSEDGVIQRFLGLNEDGDVVNSTPIDDGTISKFLGIASDGNLVKKAISINGNSFYRVGVGNANNSILGYFIYSSPTANLANASDVISDLDTRGFNSSNNAYKVSFLVVIDNSSLVSFNFCRDIFISEGTTFYVKNKRSLVVNGSSASNEINNNFGNYKITYVEKM